MDVESGPRGEKVLFFPYYWYLHYEPFRRVIARLKQAGLDALMVHMPCSPLDESAQFGIERMQQDGCPAQELPIYRIGLGSGSPWARMLRFIGLVLSRRRIERFLCEQSPDMVVVGSDLGNAHFRLLLDLCRSRHIRVLILATVSSGPTPDNAKRGSKIARLSLLRTAFRWFQMEGISFEGWVLGSYHHDAVLAVPGEAMKAQLMHNGIAAGRIVVTGNPAHDRLYEVRQMPIDKMKQEILKVLGWPGDRRLLVYCTETIQYIYGEDYLERLNKLLVKSFDDLPDECRVVVKLHPRESPASTARFIQTFCADRYRVVRHVDIHHLFRVAEVVIGHFSETLIDAALLGTPVLSINIAGDRSQMVFDPGRDILYIRSETELREKIRDILYKQDFLVSVKTSLADWSSDYALAVDGQSADRVARLIQGFVKCQSPVASEVA